MNNNTENIPALFIVTPCYNEEAVLSGSLTKLSELYDSLISRNVISENSRIVCVNDGSKDSTWHIIEQTYQTNKYVCGLNLVSNVGHQHALMAGLYFVKDYCDIAISIDADLQDDTNAIEKMVEAYKNGVQVVYGVKVSRKGDSFAKKTTAMAFYKFQHFMGVKIIYNHADFRLMSKSALQQLAQYTERNVYLRGIVAMMNYPSATVDDVISNRTAGESKYTLSKMLNLAVDGITSFSVKPLRMITALGFILLLITICEGVYVLITYSLGHAVSGWTSIMLSIWFFGSLLVIFIGIVGEYIGKIYIESKHRPLFNIGEKLIK